jgi:hypothetical protein
LEAHVFFSAHIEKSMMSENRPLDQPFIVHEYVRNVFLDCLLELRLDAQSSGGPGRCDWATANFKSQW